MCGHQDGRSQFGRVEVGHRHAVQLDHARLGVGGTAETAQQRLGGGRVGDGDADQLAGRHGQVGCAQRVEGDTAQPQRAADRARQGRVAGHHIGLGGQHSGDPRRRGPALGELGVHPREHLQRPEEEHRQSDGRHQLTQRDVAVQGEPSAHQGDQGDEASGEREHDAVLPCLGAGGPQRGGERVAAGAPVAVDGGALGADALEHPQPGDEVGGYAGGVRGLLLLGLAAGLQRFAEQVAEPEQYGGADQHHQAERQGDPQQCRGAHQYPGER